MVEANKITDGRFAAKPEYALTPGRFMNEQTAWRETADDADRDEKLENRLARLEKAIAALSDTRLMEERLVEKVMTQVPPPTAQLAPPANAPSPSAASAIFEAGKAILPGAIKAVTSELNAATDPKTGTPPRSSFLAPQSWLLTDLLYDLRTFFVLYIDYRYRPSWAARIVPLAVIAILILNVVMRQTSGLMGICMEYILDPIALLVLFKTLSREAIRYREHVAHLPPRV